MLKYLNFFIFFKRPGKSSLFFNPLNIIFVKNKDFHKCYLSTSGEREILKN